MEIGIQIEKATKQISSFLFWKNLFPTFFFVMGVILPASVSAVNADVQFTSESNQSVTITGVVSDETGEPLIGVGVRVKETSTGTLTDLDGRFSIQTTIGSTLVFSYLGYLTYEKKIESSQALNVVMEVSAMEIEEVVVTAMGVKTEKKRLNFAVQNVKSEDLVEGRASNFVNALQGRVAGVSVTNSGTGSPNSGSQILIRGLSSINTTQKNEPLFILDGMPLHGTGTNMRDINPADIESITILKGAAASALYGQKAADGVIMITTKQGKGGKVTISLDAGWESSSPTRIPEVQNMYDTGARGMYKSERDGGSGGWGPPLNEGTPTYDNIGNYYRTGSGFSQQYNLSMTGGNEKFQSYVSINFSDGEGLVVNDTRTKYGILAKGTFTLNEKITMTGQANVTNAAYRGVGSTSSVFRWPITDDITNYQELDGYPRFRYISTKKISSPVSPLFGRYNDYGKNESTRTLLQYSISYKPIESLDITGRIGLDQNNYSYDGYEVPRFNDAFLIEEDDPLYLTSPYLTESDLENLDKDLLGYYEASYSKSTLHTGTLVATYNVDLMEDLNFGVLGGGELSIYNGLSGMLRGRDFVIPGTYSISNTNPNYTNLGSDGALDMSQEHSEIRKGGLFGEIRFDYKGLANLSVTSRWDWTSTLNWNYMPYYYPSVTGGLVFSEIFNLANKTFSYGKLRANWARVGKTPSVAYLFDRKYKPYPTLPDGGYGLNPSLTRASSDLAPEMTDSWEVGLDVRLFDSRTRLDVAYYSTTVDNQIVTVRVSPAEGEIQMTRNEGNIENHGLEFSLEQDLLKNKDITWTAGLNFGYNRGKVIGLPEGTSEVSGTQYGDVFTSAYLGHSTTSLLGKDYARTEDGKVIVDANGLPKLISEKSTYIGDREPDFLAGLSSRLTYKGLSLGFLLDIRKGGDVLNVTRRGMWSGGTAKDLEFYRGRQVVWDGVVLQDDGTYKPNTTPIVLSQDVISEYYTGVSSNFVEDGSYIRLSNVTLSYDFTRVLNKNSPFSGLTLSLTGRNLFLITKYTGSDPQINASVSAGGTGSGGIDNYAMPLARTFNVSVSAKF